ncbi:hypothetical protein MJO29_012600 [Puccinia striiformis f. sp. tritici]|nr:hypothetical protein MJO29_012600 [Puccinia striiformis f. sp. tritici]
MYSFPHPLEPSSLPPLEAFFLHPPAAAKLNSSLPHQISSIQQQRSIVLSIKTIKQIDVQTQVDSDAKSMKALGESDHDGSGGIKFNDLDVHVDNVYKECSMSSEYNYIQLVYLHPTDSY